MANIRIDLEATVVNGQALTFKSPADCSQVTGLIIYYPVGDTTTSKTFQFADAHGNNVGSVSLFAEDVLVKVILDTDAGKAYVQNADTNAYLEGQLAAARSLANAAQSTADDANTLAEAARAVANGAAKIQFGTYTGTGTSGKSGACSLTFDFVPQIVLINGGGSSFNILWNYPGVESAYKNSGTFASNSDGLYYMSVSRNGTTISWYNSDAGRQANGSGGTYFYIAIG